MTITFKTIESPFYAAYAAQSEAINAAVVEAAAQSAAAMGQGFKFVYARTSDLVKAEQLAA